jgi:hypothetical protein
LGFDFGFLVSSTLISIVTRSFVKIVYTIIIKKSITRFFDVMRIYA